MRAFRSFSTNVERRKSNLTRYAVQWKNKEYYNETRFEEEMRRIFDVCHGCRRCFSFCDSFPILFEEIDKSPTEELDSVPTSAFKGVSDKCTACDRCYVDCPYQYRAIEQKDANVKAAGGNLESTPYFDQREGKKSLVEVQSGVSREIVKKPSNKVRQIYSNQDFVAPIATRMSPVVNKATRGRKLLARRALEMVANIDQDAPLPEFVSSSETFLNTFVKEQKPESEFDRKVVLFVSCFVNNNRPQIGHSVVNVLRKSNVYVDVCFPGCCGMPQFEQGLVGEVAQKAEHVTKELHKYVRRGFDVVGLTPSCTLMIKQEWPLLVSDNDAVKGVADQVFEVSEYLWYLHKSKELTPKHSPQPLSGAALLHTACHVRAQNIGPRARNLLSLIPELKVDVSERCSGHGGIFGFEKGNYDTALKIGAPVISKADAMIEKHEGEDCYVLSECPMAVDHLADGLERKGKQVNKMHPIELYEKSINMSH